MTEPIPNTKGRLLQAACEIFAEKGFHDATIAEICVAAEANIASVNYHFGDKEKLYEAVWRHAFFITSEAYPIDGGATTDAPIEDRLFAFANAILHRIFKENETGLFAKLLCREMTSPTLALDRIAEEALFPNNEYLGTIIQNFQGEPINAQTLELCKQSIIGQCAFYNFSRPLRERVIGKKTMSENEIAKIARHIARFSFGGLKEIQK